MSRYSVTVTLFEGEGSNICGLDRIYFEDSFIVNNVNILQVKEKVFVSMPSCKTKHKYEAKDDNSQKRSKDKDEKSSGESLPFR